MTVRRSMLLSTLYVFCFVLGSFTIFVVLALSSYLILAMKWSISPDLLAEARAWACLKLSVGILGMTLMTGMPVVLWRRLYHDHKSPVVMLSAAYTTWLILGLLVVVRSAMEFLVTYQAEPPHVSPEAIAEIRFDTVVAAVPTFLSLAILAFTPLVLWGRLFYRVKGN